MSNPPMSSLWSGTSPQATKSRSCIFIDFVSEGTPYVTGAIVVVKQHIMHSLFIDF